MLIRVSRACFCMLSFFSPVTSYNFAAVIHAVTVSIIREDNLLTKGKTKHIHLNGDNEMARKM